jgi:hypothetical protein
MKTTAAGMKFMRITTKYTWMNYNMKEQRAELTHSGQNFDIPNQINSRTS